MGDRFGEQIPFCEPHWYQGGQSPYYSESHRKLRAVCRKFVEEELKPNVDKWIKDPKGYPLSLHKRSYELGIQGAIYGPEYGGTRPDDFDPFHELIIIDELSRIGGGNVLNQAMINSLSLPPIMIAGSDEMKQKIVRPVVMGDKHISLAISEPWAGSDVANIRTEAKRDGDYYIVNGAKKWITGGLFADYFTMAVRTGGSGSGAAGLSLLLVDKNTPGLKVRKMETQFDNAHNTTFINLDNVKVPVSNLIGKEGEGFKLIMVNFNHERFILSIGTARMARLCFEDAFKYALERTTFGKRLVEHQIIRFKLAEMARQLESLHDFLERVAYQFKMGQPDWKMGGMCALLKVQATKTFEFCAREASQIFGGSSIVKEGKGRVVERLYREVRAQAIPGGSEEILLDFAIRSAISKTKQGKQAKL